MKIGRLATQQVTGDLVVSTKDHHLYHLWPNQQSIYVNTNFANDHRADDADV